MLEESDSNDIDDSNEETKAECNDEDPFLLIWKTHLRQEWYGEKKDRQVGDDVHRRRGEVERDDVDTFRVRGDR